jgi:protein-tyrosine phosphatase
MLRLAKLPENFTRGTLYLCSMPGRFESLGEFLHEIQKAGVTQIVCLVSNEEINDKSPTYLSAILQNHIDKELVRFEIPDYGMPENPASLDDMLDIISTKMNAGESVVIHCAAGHGRTGMVSTLLLARMGMQLDVAIEIIRSAGSQPDTPDQRAFLHTRVNAWLSHNIEADKINRD